METAKYFNADRCFIYEFGENIKSGIYIEYTFSPEVKKMSEADFTAPEFKYWEEIMFSEDTVNGTFCEDLVQYMLDNNLQNASLDQHRIKYDIKTAVGIPIVYLGRLYGALVIQYTEKITPINSQDKEFLKILANQSATALYQAELYEKEKKTAARESLLRNIIEIIRSSLNINEIKKNVVNELGKAFNADRCYFRYYDKIQNKFLAPDVEYLASDEMPSFIDEVTNQEGLDYFREELDKRKKGFYPIVVNEKIAEGTPLENYFISKNLKADYGMPILDREDELTYLVLHYTKEDPNLSEEDKNLLETIAFQVDMALTQIKLYNTTKQQTEREILLRKIVENISPKTDIYQFLPMKIANNYYRYIKRDILKI